MPDARVTQESERAQLTERVKRTGDNVRVRDGAGGVSRLYPGHFGQQDGAGPIRGQEKTPNSSKSPGFFV